MYDYFESLGKEWAPYLLGGIICVFCIIGDIYSKWKEKKECEKLNEELKS